MSDNKDNPPQSGPLGPPCHMCINDGLPAGHTVLDCPQWVAVPNNLADAKALLTIGGLSLDHTCKETK